MTWGAEPPVVFHFSNSEKFELPNRKGETVHVATGSVLVTQGDKQKVLKADKGWKISSPLVEVVGIGSGVFSVS